MPGEGGCMMKARWNGWIAEAGCVEAGWICWKVWQCLEAMVKQSSQSVDVSQWMSVDQFQWVGN
jgi:hypothetical protein